MAAKKGTRKTVKKKAAPKKIIETKIVYMDLNTPMDELELAGAFNVQKDHPLRRAIDQTLLKMRDEANADLPSSVDNHGKSSYAIGYEQGILEVRKELNKCYKWAWERLKANAEKEEPPTESTGYGS